MYFIYLSLSIPSFQVVLAFYEIVQYQTVSTLLLKPKEQQEISENLEIRNAGSTKK
jgi:hypothetical protein